MSDLLLTIDLGNSRCKLRLWSPDGARVEAVSFESDRANQEQLIERCEEWLGTRPAARHAALSSVALAGLEDGLRAGLAVHVEDGRVRTPAAGLELDLIQSETVGLDRLFAARGALSLVGASALVLGAGTALTVDVLELRGARALFRGGAIAAGPQLAARALREYTARLPDFEPRPGVPALGRDTRSALEAGVAIGFRGAARGLVEALSRECGLERAELVLSGGARRFLLEPEPFVARPLREVEDLVHLGLLAALRDELAAAGAAR